MRSCFLCDAKLGFLNSPTFGSGKLGDGNEVCISCFKKINNINPSIAFKLKKQTKESIISLLDYKKPRDERAKEIKAKIESLGITGLSSFLGRKEINELPSILFESEELEHALIGKYQGKQGMIVATTLRILFIDKGLIYGLTVEDFPYDKITSIQYESGLLSHKLKILASGNNAEVTDIMIGNVKGFAGFVRNKISGSKPTESTTIINHAPIDIADQILKLGQLKEQGLLTEEEFKQQKHKLLNT